MTVPTPLLSFNIMMLFILSSLLFPFITKDRAELVSIVSIYRPLSLIFLFLNPLAMFLAPYATPALVPVATASILAAMAFLACEIRFSRGRAPPRHATSAILLAFVVVITLVEIWWDFGQSTPKNVGFIATLAAALTVWICLESVAAYASLRSWNYLFVVVAALMAAGAVCFRAKLFMQGDYDVQALMSYGDDELFLTKSIAASGLLGMTIMLGQLYLSREWKSEAGSRRKAEDLSLIHI